MAGGNKSSYYAVLDVARDASADEIHAAWRKMSKAFHPDRVKEAADKSWVKEFVLAKYRDIQEAYDVLSDPAKKALYDAGFDAALDGDKEGRGPNMNTKKEEPAGRVTPVRHGGSSSSWDPVVQINLFFTFNNAAAPDPGTSGGGGAAGPRNGRGKQRPRRRTMMDPILEVKLELEFPDDRKD
ncbi:unnamed protein product [Urochloa humidicola]